MLESGPNESRGNRRSCTSYGCIAVLAVFVVLAGWIASGFVVWKQCRISLPDGSGSVVFKARLNKIFCAEWDRKVTLNTNRFRGVTKWMPGDSGGADPINVYWYPARNGRGPYLRFNDPICGEYLADLEQGRTLYLLRDDTGVAYAGQILAPRPHGSSNGSFGWSTDENGVPIALVDGCPARRLTGPIATQHGTYIGRIEYPFNRFVTRKELPEEALPAH